MVSLGKTLHINQKHFNVEEIKYLIIISHVHSTVKHDILSTNSHKDTTAPNIFKMKASVHMINNYPDYHTKFIN